MIRRQRIPLSNIKESVLTAEDLAGVLGCKPGTVYQMAREEMPDSPQDNAARYARVKVGNRGVVFSKQRLIEAGIE